MAFINRGWNLKGSPVYFDTCLSRKGCGNLFSVNPYWHKPNPRTVALL